jgi:hypothetical protein
MAFENGNTNGADASATPPQVDTQNAPIGDLQTPQNQPPQIALNNNSQPSGQPAQPATPAQPSQVATSANKNLHRLVGSFLGALAGTPTPDYTVNPSGQTIAQAAPALTTGQKVARIASDALVGLAAGAQAGQQKSGLASALSGAGAGAEAVRERNQQQDMLKRKQASEEFEQQQKAKLQQFTIAQGNAAALHNYNQAQKLGLDQDPIRQSGMALGQSAKDAGLDVKTITESEWRQMVKNDPQALSHYIHVPGGFSAATVDEDGTTVHPGEGQVIIIPATSGEKVALPSEFLSQVDKYATLGGKISKDDVAKLDAGHEIPIKDLTALYRETEAGRKMWLEGELKPEMAMVGPNQDQPVLLNSITHEPISHGYAAGTKTEAQIKAEQATADTAAQAQLRSAQAAEATAKAKEALANAATAMQTLNTANTADRTAAANNLMASYANLPPTARAAMQNLSLENQSSVLAGWAGREDPKGWPSSPRKGTGQLSRQQKEGIIHLFDPTWKEDKYENVKKMDEEFSDLTLTKPGGQINSVNVFFRHTAGAWDAVQNLARTNPMILTMPFNEASKYLSREDAANLAAARTTLMAAGDEWANMIKAGRAMTKEEIQEKNDLANPNNPMNVEYKILNRMGSQGIARLDELNERYKALNGSDYGSLVSPSAKKAAEQLGLGSEIAKFKTGGMVFTGGTPGSPTPNQPGGSQPQSAPQLPQAALAQLKEGHDTKFANGQTWTLKNGQPVQVQ